MPRPGSAVPSYSHHKPTGQAYVRVRTPDGRRRTVYLGPYNSPESRAEYARILAGAGKPDPTAPPPAAFTVAELLLRYVKHASSYYRGADGKHTSEFVSARLTARGVRRRYGALPAAEFGPKALATVRDDWIADGLSRGEVNRRLRVARRMFKWAAAEELVPASVVVALGTVAGVAKGRTAARETEPVKPVADDDVNATLPHAPADVADMVRVQRLTGMRPGEVCKLRPCDIDRSADVWVFRPHVHKGSWRGKDRAVSIGPQAQAVMLPHWPADPADYLFSPARTVAALHAARSAARKTPRYPSHMRRNAAKRTATPKRPPAACYTTGSYGRAVARAVELANAIHACRPLPDGVHGPVLPAVPHWHPNQLRHSHATEVRKLFGLEGVQVTLGHAHASTSEIYAERNLSLAAEVARKVG